MRSMAYLAFLWLSVGAGLAVAAPGVGWLAYGDLRGHVEPCGCDPATDLGGIRRISAVIERERARDGKIGVFVLGNNLPQPGQHAVKRPFLLGSDALNKPTATLVNVLELQQDDATLAFAKADPKASAALNLVLSNAKAGQAPPASRSEVDEGGFFVLGYTWSPELKARVQRVDTEMLHIWAKRLQGVKDRHKVLLFSGPDDDLKKIVKRKLFDSVIASSKSLMSQEPGTDEKTDERKLRRVEDPAVYAVPLGGQGLLRGGSLLFDEAKPLSAYLGSDGPGKECKDAFGRTPKVGSCGSGSVSFKTAKLVTWLDASAGESKRAKELYDRYDAAVKAEFLSAGAKRLKDLAASPYAGAAACVACHKDASYAYQASKHAHAMETLRVKGKHEDGECVSCHTVGAAQKGGFVSLAASPQLANVQCENCHGPRKEHVADPTKHPALSPNGLKPMDVCSTCHNSQHSPAFDKAEYWRRIKHK